MSIIMPTRNRHEWLRRALDSIIETCFDPEDIEILLRIDNDDKGRIEMIPEFEYVYKAKCIVGPHYRGYVDMAQFVDELLKQADSQWCWLFDDDAWLEGEWYYSLCQIECSPDHGPIVNAEFYALGDSIYKNGESPAPGLIVPTEFARSIKTITPVDQCWFDEAKKKGWHIVQLPGVWYHHDGRIRA